MMIGAHLVKSWSRTRMTLALSSAEAEFAATVKGSGECLGTMALSQGLWA